jgi:hypothetical protein
MKAITIGILTTLLAGIAGTCCLGASPADIFAHKTGIWALPDDEGHHRWVVIHNLEEARTSGTFHIEVIARKQGDPKWAISRLCPHMAITAEALARSVTRPLDSGAVYPEAFNDAYRAWKATRHKAICTESVLACLP